MDALILAPALDRERRVAGLSLCERARRVARLAGVAPGRVVVARSAEDLRASRSRLGSAPLLLLRASAQAVAPELVAPLQIQDPGDRSAVDASGRPAGALRVDAARVRGLLDALELDFEAGEATVRAEPVVVGRRARHPASSPEEVRAANRWQLELVNKPLDSLLTVYLYRPLARPITLLLLPTRVTPNVISVVSIVVGLLGCALATLPGWNTHVLGLALLVVGGILDSNDGEIARLRLEFSTFGGWLDTVGDDLCRVALLLALGLHLAPRYPSTSILPVTFAAALATMVAVGLMYWYLVSVSRTSNTQDYGAAVSGGRAGPPRSRWVRWLGSAAEQIVRRDFVDLAALLLAVAGLSVVTFVGMLVGAFATFLVVVVTHARLLAARRRATLP